MLLSFFKHKEKISDRLPSFYEDHNGPYGFAVRIQCGNTGVDKSQHLISSTTHHYVKYICECGETIKIAPVDVAYTSDKIVYGKDQKHIIHAITGVKIITDKIVDTFWYGDLG